MGAVVDIYTTATTVGYTAYTDAPGFYSANNLPPGKYQVKVTAGSFLPSLREVPNSESGAGARTCHPERPGGCPGISFPQPVKKLEARSLALDASFKQQTAVIRALEEDKTDKGGLVVVSRAPENQQNGDRLKGRVAFIAGAQADGFGSAGDMTTAFALEKSLFSAGTLMLNGNIGATAGDPSGVVRASYAHDFSKSYGPRSRSPYRHFAIPGTAD